MEKNGLSLVMSNQAVGIFAITVENTFGLHLGVSMQSEKRVYEFVEKFLELLNAYEFEVEHSEYAMIINDATSKKRLGILYEDCFEIESFDELDH